MKNLVLKGRLGLSSIPSSMLKLLQSSEARAAVRYFNTIAIFMVVGLIFSNELSSRPKRELLKAQSIVKSAELDYYQFNSAASTFKNINLKEIQNYSKAEFRAVLLASVPGKLKYRLGRYLKMTMELSEKYQVDPFWVISVMWTESHFNFKATSSVSATGLMQIMPATGEFLMKLLEHPDAQELVYEKIRDPKLNIEMGVFYLKRLLRIFKGNHKLATVAYNMGPGGVFRRLRLKLPVGVRNLYLDKVRRHYSLISKNFIKLNKRINAELKNTLVIKFPNNGYLYTQYNELDEVFQFLETPRFGARLANNFLRNSNKSL
ncbi:lytic transglycosylase domain-containing protein [Halobacteriovorax sp. HLS]|uniref:lytic transglycosylase domain-containing protein n=1 Tax=Halobacteriovorax sp. HLS TaxID=2234000 RepID=UPI000FD6BFEC|nr:lytic transglycosylase domain-containing protein [Halobacteriovorax sp. HLS]